MPRRGIDPASEWDPETTKEGDIANLLVASRWETSVSDWYIDPQREHYSDPYVYRFSPRVAGEGTIEVHSSRVLRFDGIRAPLTDGWLAASTSYWDFGVSVLTPAIEEIFGDAGVAAGIRHLVNEASIMGIRTHDLREMLKPRRDGRVRGDEMTLEARMRAVNTMKGIYRTLFLDKNDEMERVNVPFSGLPDVQDRALGRCAAIEDIPQTRFAGRSPAGLNSTGDGDLKNWALKIEGLRETQLSEPLDMIHAVVALNAGIADPPEYMWHPVLDMSEVGAIADYRAAYQLRHGGASSRTDHRRGSPQVRLSHDGFWEGLPEELPPELAEERQFNRDMEHEMAGLGAEGQRAAIEAARDGNGPPGSGEDDD